MTNPKCIENLGSNTQSASKIWGRTPRVHRKFGGRQTSQFCFRTLEYTQNVLVEPLENKAQIRLRIHQKHLIEFSLSGPCLNWLESRLKTCSKTHPEMVSTSFMLLWDSCGNLMMGWPLELKNSPRSSFSWFPPATQLFEPASCSGLPGWLRTRPLGAWPELRH